MTNTYISPTFKLYECIICKKQYKITVGTSMIDNFNIKIMQTLLNSDGLNNCCTSGTLKEIKDEEGIQG